MKLFMRSNGENEIIANGFRQSKHRISTNISNKLCKRCIIGTLKVSVTIRLEIINMIKNNPSRQVFWGTVSLRSAKNQELPGGDEKWGRVPTFQGTWFACISTQNTFDSSEMGGGNK